MRDGGDDGGAPTLGDALRVGWSTRNIGDGLRGLPNDGDGERLASPPWPPENAVLNIGVEVALGALPKEGDGDGGKTPATHTHPHGGHLLWRSAQQGLYTQTPPTPSLGTLPMGRSGP